MQSPQEIVNLSSNNTHGSDSDSKNHSQRYRSLVEIYDSCNVAFFACEPQCFEEAVKEDV